MTNGISWRDGAPGHFRIMLHSQLTKKLTRTYTYGHPLAHKPENSNTQIVPITEL